MSATTPVHASLAAALSEGQAVALCTVVSSRVHPPARGDAVLIDSEGVIAGTLGRDELERVVARDVVELLAAGVSGRRRYGPDGEAMRDEVDLFVECHGSPPHLVVVGAGEVAVALVRLAHFLGYRSTVCDHRRAFADPARFAGAEVIVGRADEVLGSMEFDDRSVVCVLSHDPGVDVPALSAALDGGAGYIGAMGSRRTTEDRLRRLAVAGLTGREISRIRAPIGLDLGATAPEQIALSIMAEVLATRSGRSAGPLSDTGGPIHG